MIRACSNHDEFSTCLSEMDFILANRQDCRVQGHYSSFCHFGKMVSDSLTQLRYVGPTGWIILLSLIDPYLLIDPRIYYSAACKCNG